MTRICLQTPADRSAIESLLDRAFGADRANKISYRFRQGVDEIADLSFVARSNDGVVATIRYWPIAIGNTQTSALLLGPLGVEPHRKGAGIGQALMRHSLCVAASFGHARVVLVGDLAYYGRFGFQPAADFGVEIVDEAAARVLALPLRDGAFDHVGGAVQKVNGLPATTPSANRPTPKATRPRQGTSKSV